MATALITHSDCLAHVTPDGHPERVDRLRAVMAALEDPMFQDLLRIEAPEVSEEAILRVHTPAHLKRLTTLAEAARPTPIDADTWMGPGSWPAARRAAGAVVKAVELVCRDEVGNAFCAVRPPGHHAERDRAMGFCLLSSAAIGARHATDALGVERVAIVDFDVHHGNGTQDVVERDGRVFFASSHQWPLYPGTGRPDETGVGNVLNVCLPAHTDGASYRPVFESEILPALDAFAPQLVVISAGFDAHVDDPLAQLSLTEEDFAWATERLCEAAKTHASGRVVSTLEGGYSLRALARSSAAHVQALMAHAAR